MSPLPLSAAARRADALAVSGDVSKALAILTRAIADGDATAAIMLGEWRLSGHLVRRDLAAVRDLFGKAADLGAAEAESVYLALLANGAGGQRPHWQMALKRLGRLAETDPVFRRQADLIAAMKITQSGDPLTQASRSCISEKPHITVFPGFMTAEECRYVTDRAMPFLQPAVVIEPTTGRAIRDPIRLTDVAAFPFVDEDPALHAINRRIMAATATRYEQGEPIQVLSYQPGQEYKLHSDCLPPGQNQRIQTFLVVLDDRFSGGETSFPRIGLKWRGKTGDAIQFINVTANGEPEPLSWHAGLPITGGRKMLLSKWIREKPLDLSGPTGRLL